MAYVEISDLSAAFPRRRHRGWGLGSWGLGQAAGPGVLSQFALYPDGNTALKASPSYGAFYTQGGQIYVTGPYGPLKVMDTSSVAGAFKGAGYLYQQNGVLYVGGPAGPIRVNTNLRPQAAAPVITATPAPPPSPAPPPPPPPPAPSGPLIAYTIPGGAESVYVVYPDSNTALKAGYGRFFRDPSGQLSITGPYGALKVFESSNVYTAFKGAGYFYQQGSTLYVGGPAGPIQVTSPKVAQCPPGQKNDPNDASKCVVIPANCPSGQINDPSNPANCIQDPAVARAAAEAAAAQAAAQTALANAQVAALTAAMNGGQIKMYQAGGQACPSYMATQTLADGATQVCIDYVKARSDAIIAAAQSAFGAQNVAVAGPGVSCNPGANPTSLPDGRQLCINPSVGSVTLIPGTSTCPSGYTASQVMISPPDLLAGVSVSPMPQSNKTSPPPSSLTTDVLCWQLAAPPAPPALPAIPTYTPTAPVLPAPVPVTYAPAPAPAPPPIQTFSSGGGGGGYYDPGASASYDTGGGDEDQTDQAPPPPLPPPPPPQPAVPPVVYVLGAAAAIGLGYYFWKKSKEQPQAAPVKTPA